MIMGRRRVPEHDTDRIMFWSLLRPFHFFKDEKIPRQITYLGVEYALRDECSPSYAEKPLGSTDDSLYTVYKDSFALPEKTVIIAISSSPALYMLADSK